MGNKDSSSDSGSAPKEENPFRPGSDRAVHSAPLNADSLESPGVSAVTEPSEDAQAGASGTQAAFSWTEPPARQIGPWERAVHLPPRGSLRGKCTSGDQAGACTTMGQKPDRAGSESVSDAGLRGRHRRALCSPPGTVLSQLQTRRLMPAGSCLSPAAPAPAPGSTWELEKPGWASH